MKRKVSIISSSLLFLLILTAVIISPKAEANALQLNPTEERQTVEAFAEQLLTATTDALSTREAEFKLTHRASIPTNTPTPEADIEAQYAAMDHLISGWAYFQGARYQEAIQEFELVIEYDPAWAEGYVWRGIAYSMNGQNELALADFEQAVELDDNDPILYAGWVGYSLIQLGRYREALENTTYSIELNPYYIIGYGNRGWAYESMGMFEEALADYTRAIELNPADSLYYSTRKDIHDIFESYSASLVDLYIGQGIWYKNDGDLAEAVQNLTRAANDYETSWTRENAGEDIFAYAFYNRGLVYVEFGNEEDALFDFNRAIEINADLSPAYTARAELYVRTGQHEQAIRDFNLAIGIDPYYAEGYLARGTYYESIGDLETATPDIWQWLQIKQFRDIIWDRHTPGQPFLVNMNMDPGARYYAPFDGQAGQIVNVTAEAVPLLAGESIDPVIAIIDRKGNPLIAANDSNGLDAAIVDFVLPVDGIYTLVIGHAPSGHKGTIGIDLSLGDILSASEIAATASIPTETPMPSPTFIPSNTPTPSHTPTPAVPVGRAIISAENVEQLVEFRQFRHEWENDGEWTPDGRYFVELGLISGILIYDTQGDLQPITYDSILGFATEIAISTDGTKLAAALLGGDIEVWDIQEGQRLYTLDRGGTGTYALGFSPDGTLLATGDENGNVRIFNVETGERIQFIRTPHDAVFSLLFSQDSSQLITSGTFGNIILWDVDNGRQIDTLPERQEGVIYTLEISPDGTMLASGSSDGSIYLWDIAERRSLGQFSHYHGDWINDLAFSPDGTLLASASDDSYVRIWRIEDRSHLFVLDIHEDAAQSVRFSADGTMLGTAGKDEMVYVWGILDTP
jgi:WD40 repeat protein/tetratricopeptide (TPR) repeat protein